MPQTISDNPLKIFNIFLIFSLAFWAILIDHIWFLTNGDESQQVLIWVTGAVFILAVLCLAKWYSTAKYFSIKLSHSWWELPLHAMLIGLFAFFMWLEYLFQLELLNSGDSAVYMLIVWLVPAVVAFLFFIATTAFYRPFRPKFFSS